MPALQDLVIKVNELTTNAYFLLRLLFTKDLYTNPNFPLSHYVNKEFYVEVFVSLTTRHVRHETATLQILEYGGLIRSCLSFLE